MEFVFVEAPPFAAEHDDYMQPEELRAIQNLLMVDPRKGVVIPGTGGIRKLRVPRPLTGRGSRGGSRILYLYLPEAEEIHLLAIYGKNEKDDISAHEKAAMKRLTDEIRTTVLLRETLRKKGQ